MRMTWIAAIALCSSASFATVFLPGRVLAAQEATPAQAACTLPVAIDPPAAFGHAIDDTRSLAFIAYLEGVPQSDRAAILGRAAQPLPAPLRAQLDAASSAPCAATEIAIRATRLVYVVSKRWTPEDGLALEASFHQAMAALLPQGNVSLEARDAVLAVFGTSTQQLDVAAASAVIEPTASTGPSPSANTSDCKISRDARATTIVPPSYGLESLRTRVTGSVRVSEALDARGYVRFATLYSKQIATGTGGDDLVAETLVSAGSASYLPQFVDCRGIAGAYLFRADFQGR